MFTVWNEQGDEYSWETGENKPEDIESEDVVCLEAIDDSIQVVNIVFVNLPMALREDKVVWFGDTAKFIFENLT